MKNFVVVALMTIALLAGSLEEAVKAFDEGRFARAQKLFEPLAKGGDAEAQFYLGLLYFTGEGGEKNLAEAGNWFKKCALQRDPKASGKKFAGISAEYDRALYWLEKIAREGDARAQFYLGVMYAAGRDIDIDYEKSAEWFEKAAKQGDELAQLNIGLCYMEGHGVPKDMQKGVAWLERAARQGNLKAQNYLGYFYAGGGAKPPDYKKAHLWYEKAAEQGYPTAQYNLALMYCLGKGVDRNLSRCAIWTKKAYGNGLKKEASALWDKYRLWEYQK